MKDIPIIIPFKENSIRCPGKNKVLFPYAIKWIEDEGIDIRHDVYVISKSEGVEQIAKQTLVNFIKEPEESTSDIYAVAHAMDKIESEIAIFFPLTQPIKQHGITKRLVDALKGNNDCDFSTTYQNVTDRRLFYIDDNSRFLVDSQNRKGCLCEEVKMLDGSMYAIKRQFIQKVHQSEDVNASFWSGKFIAIENDVLFFLDVDT